MAIVEKQMADMKTNMRYTIALMGAIVALTGCVKENLEETIKVREGDEIVFGARAGYENNSPNTKTIYKGEGSYYTIGEGDKQKTMEAVHWLSGDKVMIYCDQGQQTAHYQVTATGTGDATQAETSLQKMQLHGVANNGIQWKNIKENDHTFYAVYPSPYQFSTLNVESDLLEASNYQERITGDGTKLNCYLPVSQAPSRIEETANGYIAHPNMDYAYMIAKQVVKANANGEVPAGVDLDFRPIVTALEVTMTFPDDYSYKDNNGNDIEVTYSDLTISNVRIETTDGSPLVGPFSLDLADYEYKDNEITYPSVTIPQSSEVLNTVGVQLYRDVNGVPTPLTIGSNQTLTFTVFMLPTEIDNLKIFVDLKSGSLGNLKIEAHKKQFLVNLVLPATSSETQTSTTGSNWITQLPEDVLIEGLSIPGTANSFSYNYGRTATSLASDATSINNNYMTQTLSFDNQWNLGVRCFEIVCDRVNSDILTETLASQDVMCNGESVGLNVTDAFNRVLAKLTAEGNEKEFAMIIITYQPVGGIGNPDRNPSLFMTQLKNFYSNYRYSGKSLASYTCLYKPGLDLETIRKTPLMIVARPSQEGEDSATSVEAGAGEGYNILTVKGWGTLVDKWYKRGYNAMLFKGKDTDGWTSSDNYGNTYDNLHPTLDAMEDYIYGANGGYNGTYDGRPTRVNGNQRFQYSSDQNYLVWAQEWRRVSAAKQTLTFGALTFPFNHRTLWDESYSLKQEDIIDCLVRSISNEKGRVYFNSLDGFYVTNDRESCDVYWRGNMGDIGGYADDINAWFYPELLKYSAANVTGPLGVVILDRVNHTGAGSLIPEVIYMNNWRHTLDTSTDRISGSAWVDSWDTEIL